MEIAPQQQWIGQSLRLHATRAELLAAQPWQDSVALVTDAQPTHSSSENLHSARSLARICSLPAPSSLTWLAGTEKQNKLRRLNQDLAPYRDDVAGIAFDAGHKEVMIVLHHDSKNVKPIVEAARRLAPHLSAIVRQACYKRVETEAVSRILNAAKWHPELLATKWGMQSAPARSTYDVSFAANATEAAFALKEGLGALVEVSVSSDVESLRPRLQAETKLP